MIKFRSESWDEAIGSTWDEAIFNAVVNCNEYELDNLNNSIILDIGAHIGSFAIIANKLGAAHIYCYEANFENYKLLKENTKLISNVDTYNYAVWRSDVDVDYLFYQSSKNIKNTGSGTVFGKKGDKIPVIKFDNIINNIGHVNLLKLDVEGSEFLILFTSQALYKIDEIIGEYHEITDIPNHLRIDENTKYNATELCRFLHKRGFNVEIKHVAENLGKFHAWKPGKRRLSNLLLVTERIIELEKQLSECQIYTKNLKGELQSLYSSYSWRITAPLRFFHKKIIR